MPDSNNNLISVEEAIRQVLIRDWDPFCLHRPACGGSGAGHYERYIAPLRQMLQRRASQAELVEFLRVAKVKDFGAIAYPLIRERRAAKKLLLIKVER